MLAWICLHGCMGCIQQLIKISSSWGRISQESKATMDAMSLHGLS